MTDDIRDIRVPLAPFPAWLVAVACVAGLLCLAAAAYLFWRRRHRRQRLLLPFELALEQLEAARAMMLTARAEEFCVTASGIVRRYIEQAFHAPVTPRTTEEFLQALLQSSDAGLARHRAQLAEFLQQCDVVKFGRVSPPPHTLESLYQNACEFVRATAAEAHDALSPT
jgi:hypothetical protein